SNYRIVGFVEEASVPDLAGLARESGVPLLVDEGSGHLAARDGREVMPGGPQAGLLAGDPALLARCAKNPLARALRLDKTRLAALAWTLAQHAAGRASASVPVLEMCLRSREEIGER